MGFNAGPVNYLIILLVLRQIISKNFAFDIRSILLLGILRILNEAPISSVI